jgi:predicted transcriptional regulator
MSSKLTREETRQMLWKMIKNRAKVQIFNAFEMYGRMSLTELAERLHKSKSTIHGHLNFLLKLGIIIKEKVPLDSNPNVYENYYKFSKNAREIIGEIDFDYQPFEKLSKKQVKEMIEPAISMSRLLKSFLETQIHYLEHIRESGLNEEAVKHINHTLKWVTDRDGKPLLLSRNSSSFGFYSEREFYKEAQRVFDNERYGNVDWDDYIEGEEQEEEQDTQIEKPFLIIKASMPYGYILEYLNKQKKKSYQT